MSLPTTRRWKARLEVPAEDPLELAAYLQRGKAPDVPVRPVVQEDREVLMMEGEGRVAIEYTYAAGSEANEMDLEALLGAGLEADLVPSVFTHVAGRQAQVLSAAILDVALRGARAGEVAVALGGSVRPVGHPLPAVPLRDGSAGTRERIRCRLAMHGVVPQVAELLREDLERIEMGAMFVRDLPEHGAVMLERTTAVPGEFYEGADALNAAAQDLLNYLGFLEDHPADYVALNGLSFIGTYL